MLARGIPETTDEAGAIVQATAAMNSNTQSPAHWPHSQIVALAQLVIDLQERIEQLENPLRDVEVKLLDEPKPRRAKATA